MNELLDNKKKYGNNTTERRVINKKGKNYKLQMELNFQEGINNGQKFVKIL